MRAYGLLAIPFGALAACNALVGNFQPTLDDSSNDAPQSVPDGGDAVASEGADWTCLDEPAEAAPAGMLYAVEIRAFDILDPVVTAGASGGSDLTVISATVLPGISVRGCPGPPDCANPVTPTVATDDGGAAEVELHGGFAGFLELVRADLVPSFAYPGKLLADQAHVSYPLGLLSVDATAVLSKEYGVEVALGPDAGAGHLLFTVYDCKDRHAAGAIVNLSGTTTKTIPFYSGVGGAVDPHANQTGTLGSGGAVNVPVGPIVVSVAVATTGRPVVSSNAFVFSGGVTFLVLRARAH